MTMVAFNTYWPPIHAFNLVAPAFTSSTVDATGEKIAFLGQFWHPKDQTSKSITKVGFLPGTIVSAGGSTMRLSLQDHDLTTGPVLQPDGTQDQYVDFLISALTSDTWYQSAALSASRSVTPGDKLAVVMEFDSGGRLGADSFTAKGVKRMESSSAHNSAVNAYIGAAWAATTITPNIIFECTDGTFGALKDGFACSNITTVTYNSGSATDEYGIEFTLSAPIDIDGWWGLIGTSANTSDYEVVLYSGTTVLATYSGDGNTTQATASNRIGFGAFSSVISLTTGNTYRLTLKPTTANNVRLYYYELSAAGHRQGTFAGENVALASRVDAGSWNAPVTTQVAILGLSVCAISTSGGGGGLVTHPGMGGGVRG